MSYCRFSSDNFNCEVYAFEYYNGGYHIHVAKFKDISIPPYTLKEIGLPLDGQFFHCDTLEEFRNKLLEIKEVGYQFPERVLNRIEEELKDKKDN